MATGESCSFCGGDAGAGPPPERCPFAGEASCPLALGVAPALGSTGETVAQLDARASDLAEDGFPAIDDLIGSALGQYRIGPVLGRGTMGRVYRAEHTGLARPCAIKVMNPGLVAGQPQVLNRFWAEARAVAGLVHPHVVTVHNLGTERGYHFIEMEFIAGGGSLKRTLIHEGPLEPVRATTLVRQVVLALGAAHRAGLVHRDVKPANVLLTDDGRAKLADFGLVRRLADNSSIGAPLAGTPTFMAPELFDGAQAGPGSDLYAVGVMYYYLLSARLPFASARLGKLIRLHREAAVPDIRRHAPAVSDDMAAILKRCLAKQPAIRYASADELAVDLQSTLLGLSDPDDLIREGLQGLGAVVLGGKGRYRVLLQLPGGRLQEVYVEATLDRRSQRLLSIYSVCCAAEPDHFEFALRLNAELTYGGLSIREVDGRPMFVMTRAYPGGLALPG